MALFLKVQSAVISLPLVDHQTHVAIIYACSLLGATILAALIDCNIHLFNTAAPHSPRVKGCFETMIALVSDRKQFSLMFVSF